MRKLLISTLAITVMASGALGVQAAPSKVHDLCLTDSQKLCPDAKPGRGSVMRCVKTRLDAVSAECKTAVTAAQERNAQRKAAKLAAAKSGSTTSAH